MLVSMGLTVGIGHSMDHYSNLTENISINDIVQFFAQQGISVDEVVDTHVWAERQLCHFTQDTDTTRREEALQVSQCVLQYASTEVQDELHVMNPAWWDAALSGQSLDRPMITPVPRWAPNPRPR
jgi:hypothetical protein